MIEQEKDLVNNSTLTRPYDYTVAIYYIGQPDFESTRYYHNVDEYTVDTKTLKLKHD